MSRVAGRGRIRLTPDSAHARACASPNKPFPAKQAELSHGNLELNQHFADVPAWNEPAIRRRGEQLAREAANRWSRPAGRSVPPPEDEDVSRTERQQIYFDYWTRFVDFAATREGMSKLPQPARRDRLRFPIGKSGIRLLTLMNLEWHYVSVALSCFGPKGLEYFSLLQSQAQDIEGEIGEKPLWQKLVRASASHIALRLPNADPRNETDRQRQYEWLVENLKLFPSDKSLGHYH